MTRSRDGAEVRRSTRHAQSAAIALVLALMVAACAPETATTEDPGAAATPTSADTDSAGTDPGEEATTPTPTAEETAAGTDDATETPSHWGVLTRQFNRVSEGTWRVESLGTPFDVTIDGDWWVQPNEPGWTVFSHPDSVRPGDRDVVFIRPTTLSDPTDPSATGEPWPADDIEGWLEAIIDGVVVTEPVDAEVGGAVGIVFEVQLAGSREVAFLANADVSNKAFYAGQRYIVYWLDQGEHEPIAIIVGAGTAAFDEWAPTAESLVANVAFDQPAPHPNA